MDSLTHASLPPISHSTTHSSVVYQRSLTCASDYQEEHRKCPGIATPTMEMSEYYLPMNGVNSHYYRTQASFPIATSSFRPPHHYSDEAVGKTTSLRPTSSSSMESNLQGHDGRERPNANADPFGYAYANVNHPPHSCASTNSSDNEVQTLPEESRERLPALKSEASFHSFQNSALPPINNHVISDSRHSSHEPKCEEGELVCSSSKDEYSEETAKSDVWRDPSPPSKVVTGKKLANVKVSEKRRQQNRAAQRAMRERRKRAAQHQEIHMTAILTENAFLREKVTYLSNMLLSHAIAPAGHLPWGPMPQQEHSPPMLPPLNTANLPPRSAAAPTSSSTSSLSFPNHSIFPSASLSAATFPSAQSSLLNYYPAGPLELEYLHQGHHVAGLRNLSCPSSTSNLSRPSTADEASIDNQASVFGRWQNSSSHEGVGFQTESPIAGRIGQYALPGSISTDSCSINTASTISSPTHTDGHLVDTISTNL